MNIPGGDRRISEPRSSSKSCASLDVAQTIQRRNTARIGDKSRWKWRFVYLGVSKNRGTPKWMVYMENPIKMDDLGVPLFSETPI